MEQTQKYQANGMLLHSQKAPAAGVPCVTLAGRCHAHNVGASLLAACGLSAGWVAANDDEYVQLAVDAASDIPVSRLRS